MPIVGLTDRGLAFPEIGQIRKGLKEKKMVNGREVEIPKDLWYFRVIFADSAKDAEEVFRKLYGPEPTKIRIMLPFDEIDRCWEAWLEAYTAGRMIARSDGERVMYQVNDEGEILVLNGTDRNGQQVKHPIDNVAGHDYKGTAVEFEPVGRLRVILPELQRAAYLLVNTTSKHDIINISSQLLAISALADGKLRGVPLILARTPKEISTPSGKKRVRRVKHLLSIEADPAWVQAKLSQMRRLSMPEVTVNGFLGAGSTATDGDDGIGPAEDDGYSEELIETTALEVTPETIQEAKRPYTPDVLATVLAGWADEYNTPVTQQHRQLLNNLLLTCADGDEGKMREMLYLLAEAEEVGQLEDKEVGAMLTNWLGVHSWDGIPTTEAIEECRLLLGQLELSKLGDE